MASTRQSTKTSKLTMHNLSIFNAQNQSKIKRTNNHLMQTNLSNTNESISNHHHNSNNNGNDEICHICNEWALDNKDFLNNFLKCTQCINSYHQHCINTNSMNSYQFHSCSQIDQECNMKPNQSPSKLIRFINKPYWSRHYRYINEHDEDHKVFTDLYADQNQLNLDKIHQKQHHKQWIRNYHKSVEYKGITFTVGDVVEVRNANSETAGPQWPTNVAMIKEICDDEDRDIPNVVIFWYWRERELKWQIEAEGINDVILQNESFDNERKKFIDYHIYLDIDYDDEISLDTIMHKVIVFDKFTQFIQYFNHNGHKNDYGATYYGELFFSAPNCSFIYESKKEFKNKQFESIKKLQNEQKLHNKSMKKEREILKQQNMTYNDRMSRWIEKQQNNNNNNNDIIHNEKNQKKTKKDHDDIPILQRLKMGMDDSSDSSTDSELTESEDNGPPKLIPLDIPSKKTNIKKTKTKMQRKRIIEENVDKISDIDMNTMKNICNRFGIIKGPNIGSRLYEFASHLEAYKRIDQLFGNNDEESFKIFINKQKQSYCRDIKYALYTKGQIVPLSVMKENICKRFVELKPIYDRNLKENRKRKRDKNELNQDGMNGNGPNKKKKRKIDNKLK